MVYHRNSTWGCPLSQGEARGDADVAYHMGCAVREEEGQDGIQLAQFIATGRGVQEVVADDIERAYGRAGAGRKEKEKQSQPQGEGGRLG